MTYWARRYSWLCLIILIFPLSIFARDQTIHSMCIFGDSLSDNGNTAYLLKSLRKTEHPSYLVRPLKIFVIKKIEQIGYELVIPYSVIQASIKITNYFFDQEIAPLLVNIASAINTIPVMPSAPYWQWRFSNGKVWNEYLAPMIGLDREDWAEYDNQAFGGSWAATCNYRLNFWNFIYSPISTIKSIVMGKLIPPSLGLTVQAYLMVKQKLNPDIVYFIFSGANDYLHSLALYPANYNPAIMDKYIENIVSDIKSNTEKLINAGAKKIILLGLPNMGAIPFFAHTSDAPILTAATLRHNKRLKDITSELRNHFSEVDFLYINANTFLQRALNHPQEYGFTDTNTACIDVKFPLLDYHSNSPFKVNYVLRYAQIMQNTFTHATPLNKDVYSCNEPNYYLFWDELHPTTRAHHYLAYEICEEMKKHGYKTDCSKPS